MAPRAAAREWDEESEPDDSHDTPVPQVALPPAIHNAPAYAAAKAGRRIESAAYHLAKSRAYRDEHSPPSKFQWHSTADAKKHATIPPEQPARLIDFDDDGENGPEASWRRHDPPVDDVMAPHDLGWQGQHIESIARNHCTFIFTKPSKDGKEVHCGIWGDKAAVIRTKQAIVDWIRREMPSKNLLGTSHFLRQKSLLPKQQVQEGKRWRRDVKRQKYRQNPPMGSAFGAIGTFHWPTQEYRPEDVLGRSYEALDPIRMDCACYIVFEKDISSFHLMGDGKNVKQALLRLRKVCFQVAARQLPGVRSYFLHLEDDYIPSHISLAPYVHTKKVQATGDDSIEVGQSPHGAGAVEDEETRCALALQSSLGTKHARKKLMTILQRLHYYRGHLELRVRLGRFIATQYRLPQDGMYSIQDFQDMLQQSQFAGDVTPELGDADCESAALKCLQSADHLLTPQLGTIEDLSIIKPVYTVIFNFAEKGGDIRLVVAWHEEELDSSGAATVINEVSRKWLRLDRGAEAASPLVDVSICNLQNGSAWQFDLVATQTVDVGRLPPNLVRLAETISIDATAMRRQRSDTPWVKYVPYAPVKLLQQRASYRYELGRTDYTVELTHFQDRVFTAGMQINHVPNVDTYESRWSLEVYHNAWDTMLTANERVAVGERADWDDDVATWLPTNYTKDDGSEGGEDGFEQLLTHLRGLEALVLAPNVETFGGMAVG